MPATTQNTALECNEPNETAAGQDRGSAIIEFVGLAILLAIPLMYLMIAVAMVQAGNLAAVAASDQAARIMTNNGSTQDQDAPGARPPGTRAQAEHAIADVMHGYGINPDNARLTLTCSGQCPGPGSRITARVDVDVPLPFLPEGVRGIVKAQSETSMLIGGAE